MEDSCFDPENGPFLCSHVVCALVAPLPRRDALWPSAQATSMGVPILVGVQSRHSLTNTLLHV